MLPKHRVLHDLMRANAVKYRGKRSYSQQAGANSNRLSVGIQDL
jgi:hypothetical protein